MHRFAFLAPIATPCQFQSRHASSRSLSSLHSFMHTSKTSSFHAPSLSRSTQLRLSSTTPNNTNEKGAHTNEKNDGKHKMSMQQLNKVVIAGGTGFIGKRLAETLMKQGTSVTILTRNPTSSSIPKGATAIGWSPTSPGSSTSWYESIKDADGIVNLCGEPIVTRWSDKGKQVITSSRIEPTKALVKAINSLEVENKPKTLISASGVGYYGVNTSYDTKYDESSANGNDFAAKLCEQWEKITNDIQDKNQTKTVIIRLGVVLGAGGGALAKMIPAYQLFIGGPLGSGRQWVSWVHVDDVVNVIIHSILNSSVVGPINCTAPNAVTMGQMCQALASALQRPNLFPVPEFVLKTVFGEASMILLDGQNAVPKKLVESGYKYKYDDINDAMRAVARET